MADRHRRYDAIHDELNPRRGRSPSAWGQQSPQRWTSSSPSPSSTAQSPWRSPSRARNRSPSPAPRGTSSPRRSRSRSPPSTYTIESPQQRRQRLLAQKVMGIETYHRLLLGPHSRWGKKSHGFSMPIPVPLEGNENLGDYQQKFEFWLAQRDVTLESLRCDVVRERGYRCNYAQWRVQMRYGWPLPVNTNTPSPYGPQRTRSRSPSSWSERGGGRETERYSTSRPQSPARASTRNATEETQGYDAKSPTATGSRFYDARYRHSTFDKKRNQSGDCCCRNCDRDWDNLNRRVKQLERIVARLDLPRPSSFVATSSSPYEIGGGKELFEDEPAIAANYIDLTDDIEMEADEQSNLDCGDTPDDLMRSRIVEVTPDANAENALTAVDPSPPIDHQQQELELKPLPDQSRLLDAYNRVNDQVLLKQKEEKRIMAQMRLIIDDDDSSAVALRSQIDKLRGSTKTEQEQRDAAVAAVIVRSRADKEEDLARELENLVMPGVPSELEDWHEKCSGIASKLAEKDNELARLQKQLQSLSSLHMGTEGGGRSLGEQEAQELSGKIKLERASKASLVTERNKIFTRLMKSSREIQALVSKAILNSV